MEINDKIELAFFKKNGNDFENFVVNSYKIDYPDLLAIKPQGQKGDGANDGYLSGELLLQVYAPEKVDAKEAIKKLEHDFERAKNCGWSFKEWHFIINDKFNTIPRDVHHAIDDLKKNNSSYSIKLVDSESLKNMLISQTQTNRLRVYILLNINKDISSFGDFEAVEKVINAISNEKNIRNFTDKNFINFSKSKFKPDGIKKLEINIKDEDFSNIFGTYIEKSKEVIEEYKEQIGLDIFGDIGVYITDSYDNYNKHYIPEESLLKTFEKIYDKLDDDRNLETALWVIIAYFFDICDIGDIE